MTALLWWGKNLFILLVSIFFLLFGVGNLVSAYQLGNPHEFILFFFSSSLMILISLTGIIYVFFRVLSVIKPHK